MTVRGGRVALCCTIVGLTTVGALAPAAQGVEEPVGGDDVVVLELTDDDGVPTDLAAGRQVDGAVLTDELVVPEFSVAAVTWDGLEAPDETFSLRVRTGGEWTAWAELEPDAAEAGDVGGTEPYIVGGASGVQLRVAAGDGVLPRDMRLHLIPPEPGGEEAVATTPQETAQLAADAAAAGAADGAAGDAGAGAVESAGPATAAARGAETAAAPAAAPEAAAAQARVAVSAPRVIHRAGWGADESTMTWTPRHDPLRAAVVHHTAGSNSYTAAQSAGIVRGIYHYHAVSRDWGDIGYNFLVDKYGQVFEGRAGSLNAPSGRMPEAAHARGFNRGTLGISVLGDYSSLYAPDSVLNTMARVIAWKFDAADIDMSTPSGMTSPGTAHRPAGQNLARVFAHRDVGATTCPGNNIYARIPRLNEQVATLLDGDEYHLRNSLTGGDADLAFRLGLSTDEVLVGDWDGDGKDTLALRRGNTYLVYDAHPGQRFRTVRYGRPDDVVLVGDWNGDGKDTFAVRRGQTYHVKNSMTGGDADAVIHYGRRTDDVLVGDWNGDRRDTFAVRRGADYHVKNRIAGGDADVVLRYGRAGDVVLVGDWDRNGTDTFAVRRGREYHVRNSLTGGDAHVVLTYGKADDVVLVGDWNGDGRDSFGVRRSG